MNIDLIVKRLHEKKLLVLFSQKRLLTSVLPITLYIKLVRACLATKKPMASVLATAIETYCKAMEEKHSLELKALATLNETSVEEIVMQEMELMEMKRIKKSSKK